MRDIKKLTAEAEVVAGAIKRDMNWIILRKEDQTIKTLLNILKFVNYVELFYRNILQKRSGCYVKQADIVQGIIDLKADTKFLKAYGKIKQLRNAIVHSVNLVESLHNYFTLKDGIVRAVKLDNRMQIVIADMKEDIALVS